MVRASRTTVVAFLLLSAGCAKDPRDIVDYSNEPIGMQLLRAEPGLKQRRFNTLLDFEKADDLVFVKSHPDATTEMRRAHTGKASGAIGTAAQINLASVMVGRPFPADWTLAGGYIRCDRAATIDMRCTTAGHETHRTVDIPAGKWTPAFLDLTQMTKSDATGDATIQYSSNQPMLIDDVMVIDNTQWFVGGEKSPWTIRQKGFKISCEREGWFSIGLDSIDGNPGGWNIEELSTMRVTFRSAGKTKWLTVYSDGRTYWDGKFEPLSSNAKSDPILAQEHDHPGAISIAEGMGRIDRNTSGDANNDGYNERLAAYQIVASGPRMELTLNSKSVPLVRPIVEIAGLPNGKPLITLEGRLIESFTRLKNGNVLIEVPARIEQPATMNVRVE